MNCSIAEPEKFNLGDYQGVLTSHKTRQVYIVSGSLLLVFLVLPAISITIAYWIKGRRADANHCDSDKEEKVPVSSDEPEPWDDGEDTPYVSDIFEYLRKRAPPDYIDKMLAKQGAEEPTVRHFPTKDFRFDAQTQTDF